MRGARGPILRKTLHAYFATGQNAASAAAVLGVHEKTVSNRLRAIEEHLGHPIEARRAELELALRLAALQETDQPPAFG
jgi:DNA-binding PucR family transcriptional regulator